ncbi:uncharacterized protein Z520_04575 [Fonsecaea multimorphosa CBS 102226]|uniref:Heterokaryon incompatibility domain-containing protein n=1 Tax=Fonsecaea multimorphosa CBS 102226 TaxID=1442371 RepID=A0A0D2K276_9EURO|nr:uncharacterized protein Z520_04575 [Fonsecaea multimorphosa CBS 102226]KIX99937.1 hypothetical protein Z520_04575 [Fonsecaea multimorphosa CBS 102226]OAL26412.1 hypothetical protein AYO22_04330 [Fonsecaea multimorphosa]
MSSVSESPIASSNEGGPAQGSKDPAGSLSPGEFRLFYLEPASEHVTGRLRVFKLDGAPDFRALSYTCGDPYRKGHFQMDRLVVEPDESCDQEPSCTVICNDEPIKVIPNLFNALHNFTTLNICGWLWIDAICIRQNDMEERAAQIKIMGTIYSRAAEVLIWLGHETSLSSDFVYTMKNIAPIVSEARAEGTLASLAREGSLSEHLCKGILGVTDFARYLMEWSLFTYTCRWFHRLWTTQELVLTEKPRFFCDQIELDWGKLASFAFIVSEMVWTTMVWTQLHKVTDVPFEELDSVPVLGILSYADPSATLSRLIPASSQQEMESLNQRRRHFIHLHNILAMQTGKSCRDPRDRVFALLGIAEKQAEIDFATLIQPDYSKSCEQIYIELASLILRESRCLDLLGWACLSGDLSLPSWTADYRRSPREFTPIHCYFDADKGPFDSAGETFHNDQVYIDGRILRCLGANFDIIQETYPLHSAPTVTASSVSLLSFLKSHTTDINGYRPLEMLFNTLTFNDSAVTSFGVTDQRIRRPLRERSFVAFLASFLVVHSSSAHLSPLEWEARADEWIETMAIHSVPTDSEFYFDFSIIRDVYQEFTQSAFHPSATCKNVGSVAEDFFQVYRKTGSAYDLFYTKSGLVGMGRGIREGDQVFILADAHTPYILRPTENAGQYRVVTDCFILDHIHGEVWDKYDPKKEPIALV